MATILHNILHIFFFYHCYCNYQIILQLYKPFIMLIVFSVQKQDIDLFVHVLRLYFNFIYLKLWHGK